MSMDTLKDLYLHEIQDLHSACAQSKEMTDRMAKAAGDAELKEALEAGSAGIADGMKALLGLCDRHGVAATDAHCNAMQGMVQEAQKDALDARFGDAAVRDAMIIAQYQKMAHYAIAGYGTVHAFAERLGLDEDARTLKELLENTRDGDERMTRIAVRGGVNRDAA